MRVIKKLMRPLYERLPATRRDRDLARRLEHLEFTQRRILAAIEASRLESERRGS
ncbi:hypothetical protein [Natronoglycomyces albus]|uniref:Uncharacterized protein n=1 Tax=Natronoglycomyces albus TaxID=2811108 RepID=A0A895XPX7_9ACTN|nr:hypothetical protein [Natronoglycomyces albus]QSB05782.1 hypothetical protein JQS30_02290 [Natronoglycomyces albus]